MLNLIRPASKAGTEPEIKGEESGRGLLIIDENGDGFGNYKLPVIFIVMLLPLLFGGAGKWSLDYQIKKNLLRLKK